MMPPHRDEHEPLVAEVRETRRLVYQATALVLVMFSATLSAIYLSAPDAPLISLVMSLVALLGVLIPWAKDDSMAGKNSVVLRVVRKMPGWEEPKKVDRDALSENAGAEVSD